MKRIDELTEPPEVGRMYLVPTVRGVWDNRLADWPVIGPQHNDKHCLNFDWQHYHLDARFLSMPRDAEIWEWRHVLGSPLQVNNRLNSAGLPAPVFRARRCKRLANPFLREIRESVINTGPWKCLREGYSGKQARHDGSGWVCPHRNVALAGQPVTDGVIICPLHMLAIDAATGKVLP